MKPFSHLRSLLRFGLTACALIAAVLGATALWRHYMISPWTRDGRVRVETVTVAPEVSGKLIELKVKDNQAVRKGDVLFVVDPSNYRIARDQAQAALDGQGHSLRIARIKADGRARLSELSVSREDRESYESAANVAAAATEAARAQLERARIDLERAVVRSPVNGYVVNLRLREGDYVTAGQPTLAVVDSDSFWVAGYFEETQLASVHPGDSARFTLMGYPDQILTGRVDSVSRGVADQNAAGSMAELSNVNPVFTWVRLAQRIPVRIAIDSVPPEITLAAGMTATVSIGQPSTFADDLAFAIRFWARKL
ncbi:HlyD family secretion protein [Rhodoblastus sp.]|jgi:multidrug resistance efflux pump|uniref:efflux RND transporter periplasmic adaptor subunit n=1 Tax=Rhodoblastus sp. TaxID=1962975 RepID=UPI0025E54618|nr:HlyD family secretion protein [Rhodoblastus sp.]